jgi:haloalkane dehalogenase
MTQISPDFPYESRYVDVYGSKMHYIQEGRGNPILLLHGIPTSSYVWRNVIPHLASLGCCIAPDLMGFGKSDKPDIAYTILDHIKYIEKFIETLQLTKLTVVMHGWGSIIGFDYAMRHENHCRGLVFYESYLRPFKDDEVSFPYQEQILSWQDAEHVNDLVINGAQFIDKVIPQGTMRPLTAVEMHYYREPFVAEGTGKPISQYLNDLPHGEDKNKVNQLITEYSAKLVKSPLPKLLLYSIPGFITTIATVMWAKENLSNLEVIDMGEELHYVQESNPALMGEAISIWLQAIEQNNLI